MSPRLSDHQRPADSQGTHARMHTTLTLTGESHMHSHRICTLVHVYDCITLSLPFYSPKPMISMIEPHPSTYCMSVDGHYNIIQGLGVPY